MLQHWIHRIFNLEFRKNVMHMHNGTIAEPILSLIIKFDVTTVRFVLYA